MEFRFIRGEHLTPKSKQPLIFLQQFIWKLEDDALLHFSRFVTGGRGKTLRRAHIEVQAKEVTTSWVQRELGRLNGLEELVLHSDVRVGATVRHLAFLDLVGRPSVSDVSAFCTRVTASSSEWALYDSKNSYHLYFLSLLSRDAWYKFLGESILGHTQESVDLPIVDHRWIGHSIVNGSAALRWSKSSYKQLGYPELLHVNAESSSVSV